jgi:hypothetical protein
MERDSRVSVPEPVFFSLLGADECDNRTGHALSPYLQLRSRAMIQAGAARPT